MRYQSYVVEKVVCIQSVMLNASQIVAADKELYKTSFRHFGSTMRRLRKNNKSMQYMHICNKNDINVNIK